MKENVAQKATIRLEQNMNKYNIKMIDDLFVQSTNKIRKIVNKLWGIKDKIGNDLIVRIRLEQKRRQDALND